MNYRQWKKNYKKKYGHNPSIFADKRRKNKFLGRVSVKIDKAFTNISLSARKVAGSFACITATIQIPSLASYIRWSKLKEEEQRLKEKLGMILCKVKPEPEVCQQCTFDCTVCELNNDIYELIEPVEMDYYKVRHVSSGIISYVPASRVWDIVDCTDDLR